MNETMLGTNTEAKVTALPEALSAAEAQEPDTTEAVKRNTANVGVYLHLFSEPFQWMGKTYTELEFNFAKLRGSDSIAIRQEMQAKGQMLVSPKFSGDFQVALASKACGLGTDAFESMSFLDVEEILSKAKNFIPSSALI